MKFKEIFAQYKEAKTNARFCRDVLKVGRISRRDRAKYEKLLEESNSVINRFHATVAQLDETQQQLIERAYIRKTYNWYIKRSQELNMSESKLYRELADACRKVEDMW